VLAAKRNEAMSAMKSKKREPQSLVRVGVMMSLGLAGCGRALDLSELPPLPLEVRLPGCTNCVGLELTLRTDRSDCPRLASSTRATLNGHALTLSDPGGMGPGLGPALPDCHPPQFTSSLTTQELGLDQESSRIELTGGGKTLLMEGLSLDAERSLRWTAPGDPVLYAGQQVSLELSVPTDEFDRKNVSVMFTPENGESDRVFSLSGEQLTYEGPTLRFTPPSSLRSGRGTLYVSALVLPKVTRCEGFASCTAGSFAMLTLTVTTVGK
jgi:hypothetical protein